MISELVTTRGVWREKREFFIFFYLIPSRELVLHKITLNNKENNEKTYNFNQKKFSFIFTLRIYIGHCYKYNILTLRSTIIKQ